MKRIEFIAPVEALRGNMSGKQTLVYAQNDNPAFDAPAGRQYARNYKPRYIGHRRAKDGAVYFSVKRRSATKVDAASKITMAALGTIQDLKNTFKDDSIQITVGGISGSYWGWIQRAYQTGINHGEIDPNISLDKWIDGILIDMLRYRQWQVELRLRINPNVPTVYSLTIKSPYNSLEDLVLPITQRNFIKFNPVLTTNSEPALISINGMTVVLNRDEQMLTWAGLRSNVSSDNPNYTAQLTPLAAEGTTAVTWAGQALYSSAGVEQKGDTLIVEGEKYTTIAPQA